MLNAKRFQIIVYVCLVFNFVQAKAIEFEKVGMRSALLDENAAKWAEYAEPHCFAGAFHRSFCDIVISYSTLDWTNNFLKGAAEQPIPDLRLPKEYQVSDYWALNWFSDAFSTDKKHEAIIRAMFLNAVARSAMEKAVDNVMNEIDKFPARRIYRAYQGPALRSYLRYSHPFLQVYMASHLSSIHAPVVALQDFYKTLHSKKPIFDSLKTAMVEPMKFPLPELDQVRQVYELNQFIGHIRSLPVEKLIRLLTDESAMDEVEGFSGYMTKVKELSRRHIVLSDAQRLRVYRSAVLLDEVLELIESLPSGKGGDMMVGEEDSLFDDFWMNFTEADDYFTGLENEIPNK